MILAQFLAMASCNLGVLLVMIKWRGLNSCEGLGLSFLALVVGADAFGLVQSFLFDEDLTRYVLERMEAEIIPTLVHILGLGLFAIGLLVVSPSAYPIKRDLSLTEKGDVIAIGWAYAVIGICMKLLAMYLWGIDSLIAYLTQLYAYDVSTREYGFLDQGVAIASFGMVLMAMGYEGSKFRQGLLLLASSVLSVLLSTGKSGLFHVFIPFLLLAKTFSRDSLRRWLRVPIIALVGILFVVGLGLKTDLKYGGSLEMDISAEHVIDVARITILKRLSASGLYQDYCNLVNRISENPSLQLDMEVAKGVVAGIVPRFVWRQLFSQEKPDHPFHAKGELVREDYRVDNFGNDAPTLVGFAFADLGFVSLALYMTIGGFVLGFIRVSATSMGRSAILVIGYLYFTSRLGLSLSESGFLNLLYETCWAMVMIAIGYVVTLVRSSNAMKLQMRPCLLSWVFADHSRSFSSLGVNGGRKAATILSVR